VAVLSSQLFRFAAVPGRPRRFGARLCVYLLASLAAWLFPPWGALLAMATVLACGRSIRWGAWLRSLGWLWLFILAPLATALSPTPQGLLPAAWRCLTFLVLLAASHWLSATSTISQIRGALLALLRPLGRRAAAPLSLAGALVLCFIPWVLEQMDAARQAGELRGTPVRRPILALRALSLPVLVRLVEKARHTSEALELRGY
jgi:energy-coupling factor transporter transmembrane protein EcfT